MDRDEPVYRLPPDVRLQRVTTPLTEVNDFSRALLGIPTLWKSTAGEGIVFGVIDTGCATEHPDLAGQILDAEDFTRSIWGPGDMVGHGTWCIGELVAAGNEIGVRGLCHKAKVLSAKGLGDTGGGTDRQIAAGFKWCWDKGAQIISLSLGGPRMSDELRELLAAFVAKPGHWVIAAAGNDAGPVNYPAAWTECIAVGSCDRDGNLSRFTSRGERLDVLCYGEERLSTIPSGYGNMSGTSMACPTVAGIAGLIAAKHREHGGHTELNSVESMRAHLKKTARRTVAGEGVGLIDPVALDRELDPPAAAVPEPPSTLHLFGLTLHVPPAARDWFSVGA